MPNCPCSSDTLKILFNLYNKKLKKKIKKIGLNDNFEFFVLENCQNTEKAEISFTDLWLDWKV